ncbi:MAG: hypothetical protein H7240_00825 [Glaciimonas sp.]|nr:hypothetical protein [Glaciimonas sp.]
MPVSTTTGAALAGVAASAFTLTGSFISMQHNYLVTGFFGGIMTLRFIAELSSLRMVVSSLYQRGARCLRCAYRRGSTRRTFSLL